MVRGAEHEYVARRAVADAVSPSLLRLTLAELPEQLAAVRSAIATGAVAEIDLTVVDGDEVVPDSTT